MKPELQNSLDLIASIIGDGRTYAQRQQMLYELMFQVARAQREADINVLEGIYSAEYIRSQAPLVVPSTED